MRLFWNLSGFMLAISCSLVACAEEPTGYPQQMLANQPELHFSFEHPAENAIPSKGSAPEIVATTQNGVQFSVAGPRSSAYPDFSEQNLAARFSGKNYLRIAEPAGPSPLKFGNGDAITMEAWIRPEPSIAHSYPYILGKGRNQRSGFPANDQNYSLRLDTRTGTAFLSFLFFSEGILKGGTVADSGHRWTSSASVPLDGDWHHVAIVYEFGKPKSIRGYIDGKPTAGTWDLGGETTEPPVVNDNEVWLGASAGGSNGFKGDMDEIAIYRKVLPEEVFAKRYRHNEVNYLQVMIDEAVQNAPTDVVRYELYEGIGESRSWKVRPRETQLLWTAPGFGITEFPRKYNERGIIIDRQLPALLHASSQITLPAGEHELILRCLNSTRLYVDGKMIQETPFMNLHSSAHGTMHEVKPALQGEVTCPAAHEERRIAYKADGKPHTFSLVTIVGHKSLPAEIGEWTLAVKSSESPTVLLGPQESIPFDDAGWLAYCEQERIRMIAWNADHREQASLEEQKYWEQRHAADRDYVAQQTIPEVPAAEQGKSDHPIDRFVQQFLKSEKLESTGLVDDEAFLRRLTLDMLGRNPTPEEWTAYWEDPAGQRRDYLIERMLNHPEWADHWVSYWQDVLAENPGLTKPNLNNSGPFRYYLHDAFSDNRSFDRIVTELILQDGSRWHGGTAGFGVASNNDVPMAAKAHIVGTAFLGIEMKCARCHDAPYHESLQRDLFSVAAMLDGKPVAVPNSSSIIASPEQLARMPVKVTLKPGEKVGPAWPFEELVKPEELNKDLYLRDPDNSRAVLAGIITNPTNQRFAQVTVNRTWKRLLGMGLVEPAEDWETGSAMIPELLDWLSWEFVKSGYDLKSLTRLIVSSNLYQQEAISGDFDRQSRFAAPTRRLLTGEQVVDTIYSAVGKSLPTERLTYNSDGRQAAQNFIDLGVPRRAWELVAISNERERPSMALPLAQSLINLMASYHWRSERQDPVTDRESTVTPLQPMALANGSALNRAVDISDQGEIVEVCLNANTPQEVVTAIYQRVLTRNPDQEELSLMSDLLSDGFAERKVSGAEPTPVVVERSPLTWTAHFDPNAALEGIRQQEVAEQGDIPTSRLTPEWRERAEDVLWTVLNSPEFVFVP